MKYSHGVSGKCLTCKLTIPVYVDGSSRKVHLNRIHKHYTYNNKQMNTKYRQLNTDIELHLSTKWTASFISTCHIMRLVRAGVHKENNHSNQH